MPPLTGDGDQADGGAIALKPFRTLGGSKPLRPILQLIGHGIGADRDLIPDSGRTQLVHPGGHLILCPVLVLLVSGAIQRVLM